MGACDCIHVIEWVERETGGVGGGVVCGCVGVEEGGGGGGEGVHNTFAEMRGNTAQEYICCIPFFTFVPESRGCDRDDTVTEKGRAHTAMETGE